MPADTLRLRTLEPGILEIRLHRPETLNALNPALIGELVEAFSALQRDRDTRVVVLTGEGRGFCSGADMLEGAAPGAIPGTAGMSSVGFVYKYQEELARLVLAVHECDKPVVAAVNGAAVGGGLGIALACDVRIASVHAKFGAVVVKVGLSACDVGTSYFLPRIVGAGAASELMLTGRVFDAQEALALRLVSRVVPPEELGDAALATARLVAANSEYGVWMTKKTLWSSIDATSLRQALEMENRTQVLGTVTGAMQEARQAFAEGRAPRWPRL